MDPWQEPFLLWREPSQFGRQCGKAGYHYPAEDLIDSGEERDRSEVSIVPSVPFFVNGDCA